jgi:tetratricopeptide (TPR) repeat protein
MLRRHNISLTLLGVAAGFLLTILSARWFRVDAAEMHRARARHSRQETGTSTKLHADRYAYGSAQFTNFVSESFKLNKAGSPKRFYDWMEQAYQESNSPYPGTEGLKFSQALKVRRTALAASKDPKAKAEEEIEFAAWTHKLIKLTIPRFSLDRGFEFSNVVTLGERQCFLQSVLISSILQDAGMDAGVVMVFQNPKGQYSNNGHAVCLLKLPDGRDTIVDASNKDPFPDHKGLFVRTTDYVFVHPVYEPDSKTIASYMAVAGKPLETSTIKTLDLNFIHSQFWYYRGERVDGGLVVGIRSNQGIDAAQKAFRTSVHYCPKNPLAVYMLGRTYLAQGDTQTAKETLTRAFHLYEAFGWVPDGPKQYLALSGAEKKQDGNSEPGLATPGVNNPPEH